MDQLECANLQLEVKGLKRSKQHRCFAQPLLPLLMLLLLLLLQQLLQQLQLQLHRVVQWPRADIAASLL